MTSAVVITHGLRWVAENGCRQDQLDAVRSAQFFSNLLRPSAASCLVTSSKPVPTAASRANVRSASA
jgi:hypothetical protein